MTSLISMQMNGYEGAVCLKKRNTVFLLISVNVSVVVKFTEIGSVKY